MQHILATTDFSARSTKAVRRAALLARDADAALTLLHVMDEAPEALIAVEQDARHRLLRELAGEMEATYGVACRTALRVGAPYDAILTAAADANPDIIVMGAHRKNLLKDVFVGTTIERVIRTGAWPILMVNREPTQAYGNILFALDLSEASAAAARAAAGLGLLGTAHRTLAHAFDPVAKSKMILADVAQDRIEAYVKEEQLKATSELLRFAHTLPIDAGGCNVEVVEGDPAPVIAGIVQRERPDLVIAGTHGRSGIAKFFLGSVAEQLLRTLETDILAVPQKEASRPS